MKIVSINSAPTACDRDGLIRRDITDLNLILANIDTVCGRNDAIIAYVHALRDLQVAHNESAFADDGTNGTHEERHAEIDRAQAAVAAAFDRLIVCEFALNRQDTVAEAVREEWGLNVRL